MISPRLARRIATIHKWLGLIVAFQLVIWTGTGLFFAAFHITDIRGEHLVHPPGDAATMNADNLAITSADALKAVAEDRPIEVILRPLGDEPIYEVRGEIGTFLVSATTGEVIDIDEPRARALAQARWIEPDAIVSATFKASAQKGIRPLRRRLDRALQGRRQPHALRLRRQRQDQRPAHRSLAHL